MAPTPTWNELLGWQRAWFERGYAAALLAVGTPESYPPTAQEAYGRAAQHRRKVDQPAPFKPAPKSWPDGPIEPRYKPTVVVP